MLLRRLHLFEFEDQSWFPNVWRDAMTDYLRHISSRMELYRHAIDPLERVLEKSRSTRIVDLCSGGAGPLTPIVKLWANSGRSVPATLTDLYPNHAAFEESAQDSDGLIGYRSEPVDASRVPADLEGLRTIFNGLHHFRPAVAQAVLADAV